MLALGNMGTSSGHHGMAMWLAGEVKEQDLQGLAQDPLIAEPPALRVRNRFRADWGQLLPPLSSHASRMQ